MRYGGPTDALATLVRPLTLPRRAEHVTITATATVPARCRLSSVDTLRLPRLDRLAVLDAAGFYGLTAYEAFRMGARIRTEADVTAIAATMPPLTPAQVADLDRWCAKVAVTPVRTIAEWYGCSYATAEHVRELMGGTR